MKTECRKYVVLSHRSQNKDATVTNVRQNVHWVCADATVKLISTYFPDFYNTIGTWGLLGQQDVLAVRKLVPVSFIKSGTRSMPL